VSRGVNLGHADQYGVREGVITSTSNQAVKRIRALGARKERERAGLTWAEGIRLVLAALDARAGVETLVVAPELLTSETALDRVATAERGGTPVLRVSAGVFQSLSRKDGPQGLGAVLRPRWIQLSDVVVGERGRWLALVEPQDPGNVGTILRTAGAAGVDGVILVGPSADPYDPEALRASTGAAFTVPLARCSWDELAGWARRAGVAMVGAAGRAGDDYRSVRYPGRLVLIMGSEREGLSAAQRDACELLVSIPMAGKVDSLNLAVATGVLLYEIHAQLRTPSNKMPK